MATTPHQGFIARTRRVRAPGTRTTAPSFQNCRTVETMLLCVYENELDHTQCVTHLGMQLFCIHGTQFQVLVNLCTVVAERCT